MNDEQKPNEAPAETTEQEDNTPNPADLARREFELAARKAGRRF